MDCLQCAAALPPDARFCANCGKPVVRTEDYRDPLRDILAVALGRQYEIVRSLGRGGMGAVYLAREVSLDREVAIKVLPSTRNDFADDTRERFRREARTAARLSHPNIVPLHTFGDVDGTLYFVMGYVRGESLGEKLKREGRLDVETARSILDDVARALEYAHGLGIVHRDVKPDNVLIEEETGRAILTDFGVAKPLESGNTLTLQGSLIGTPQYMSPEQASGAAVDHRSDLYSLGVMGFEMLAGRLPFQGRTTSELLVQHMTAEPPMLITIAPDLPVELSIALTRCLAKDPDRRWLDAAEFRTRLRPPEEGSLPDEFGDVRELAGAAVLFPLLLAYVLVWLVFSQAPAEDYFVVLAIGGLAVAVPFGGGAWKWTRLRKLGYEHRRIRREALRQPKRWIGWYPAQYRPEGDVWHRLPPDVRRARAWLAVFIVSAFVCVTPSAIAFMARLNRPGFKASSTPAWLPLLAVGGIVPLLTAAFYDLRSRRALRRAGASEEVVAQLASMPMSATAFWSRSAVARLLLPDEARSERPRGEPTSAPELLASIRRIVSAPAFPVRELQNAVLHAAEQLARSIDALDRELDVLAVNAGTGERDRLTIKLAALGSPEYASHAGVRAMIEQQLDAVTKLESRLASATRQRTERIALLKTLWFDLTALAAADAEGEMSHIVERVRASCQQLVASAAELPETSVQDSTGFSDQPTIVR